LTGWNQIRNFSKDLRSINYHANPSSGRSAAMSGQSDVLDNGNGHYSRLYERAKKKEEEEE